MCYNVIREVIAVDTSVVDRIDAEIGKLDREKQLELARRLLNRVVDAGVQAGRHSIMEWFGAGKGTWRTAEDVRRYIEEERNSWDS